MRKSFSVIITFVLLLSMLVVPFAVSADTADDKVYRQEVTYDSADIWKTGIRDNDWGCANKSDNDGWTGAVMWSKGTYSYATDTKVLTLTCAPGYAFQFRPYLSYSLGYKGDDATTHIMKGTTAFSAAFDLLYDPDTFEGISVGMSNATFFTIDETGKAVFTTDAEPISVGTLTEGWNTIKFYYIANMEGEDITSFNIYGSVNDTNGTANISASVISAMPSTTWSGTALTDGDFLSVHFSSKVGSAVEKKTVSFRNFLATKMTIILPTADFCGMAENISEEKGTEILIPTADGVVAWKTADSSYYFPGDTYTLNADTTFIPVLTESFTVVNGYDSATQWATSTPSASSWGTFYHKGDGTSPILQWYGTENVTDGSASGWTYDATEKSVMIYKGDWNKISLYPKKSPIKEVSFAGANSVVTSFDFKFTGGGGASIGVAGSTISISGTGVVKIANEEVATLSAGWNNFQIYYIPVAFADDGTTPTTYQIYVGINQAAIGTTVSVVDLLSLPHFSWTHGALGEGDGFAIEINASTAAVPLGFRNIRNNRLDATSLSNVYIEELGQMITVPTGTALTLPTAEGTAAWTDGQGVYAVSTEFTPTEALTMLTPLTESAMTAYSALSNALTALSQATDNAARVDALDALVEAMADPNLDPTSTQYVNADAAKTTVVDLLNQQILDALAVFDEDDATAGYNLLIASIALYNDAKAYISDTTVTQLTTAIATYNGIVEDINADVVDAITTAVSVSVHRMPNTEIVAILADIKSKVEENA